MNEENNKRKIFNIATILTVGGTVLYQMGWMYWSNYFEVFNVNESFIEMSIEKCIATT